MTHWGVPVAVTLITVLILGLLACICGLNRKNKADNARWKRLADQRYREGRSEASQILRSAVDQIADDKARLAGLSDRELLTEALMGLAGLGRRMDRMEDSLHNVDQLDGILRSVAGQASLISENAELLGRQVTQAQDAAASFQSAVSGTSEAVYSLSDTAHSAGQLLDTVSGQMASLQALSGDFSRLQDQLEQVVRRINQTLKVSADNPAAALGRMDSRLDDIFSQLQNLADGLNLMAESLEGVQENLDASAPRGES